MKLMSVYAVCFIVWGILGCSLISAKTNKKQDLYMHSFTCDSLGVEKTEFDRNEKWYACFIVRNDSKVPIKYKIWHPDLLGLDYVRPDGGPSQRTFQGYEQYDSTEYILAPQEHLSKVIEFEHAPYATTGMYKAEMFYLFHFVDKKYAQQARDSLQKYIPFYVK